MALFKCVTIAIVCMTCSMSFALNSPVDCVKDHMVSKKAYHDNFWSRLSAEKVVKYSRNNQYSRDLFAFIQNDMESAIADCTRIYNPSYFLIILHDFNSTNLLINDKNIPDLNLSEKGKKIFLSRSTRLKQYLNSGGMIIAAYHSHDHNKYTAISSLYKNFISKPVKTLGNDKIGATYLIKDDSGTIYIWSVDEYSITKKYNTNSEMRMWFGTLDDKEVSKRLVYVESFLKSEGIDIYQHLGLDGVEK